MFYVGKLTCGCGDSIKIEMTDWENPGLGVMTEEGKKKLKGWKTKVLALSKYYSLCPKCSSCVVPH